MVSFIVIYIQLSFIASNVDQEEFGMLGNYKNLFIQKKNIACKQLFEDSIHDEPAPPFQLEPYEYIPECLLQEFTYGNRILVKRYFFKDSFPSDRNSGKIIGFTAID